ncbi:hypothetical protein [Catenulispora pinisilvae]|uniref:hypothetical protein n=1 Tax=Catenulispora pinisilvae TaxID=2705253 RepID=UPI001891403E|nr:hypothetical protein [Catenulispora pinisilvae]
MANETGTGRPGAEGGFHPIPVRQRKSGPDPATVLDMYVEQQRTLKQICTGLHTSYEPVIEVLNNAGVSIRSNRRRRPVSEAELRRLYLEEKVSVRALSKRWQVSTGTVDRWLAAAGAITPPDGLDTAKLRRLYDAGLPVREIARRLGCPVTALDAALTHAGIPRRPTSAVRSDREHDATITDAILRQVYVGDGLTLKDAAAKLGVSRRYLGERLEKAGLVKRLGAFTAKTPYSHAELRQRATELYKNGASMLAVAEALGVEIATVRKALHEAGVPTRRRGFPHTTEDAPRRSLIDDLYADPAIIGCLNRHGVLIPADGQWTPAGPTQSLAPLPLSAELMRELYQVIGLATLHITMLCGVGIGTVRKALSNAGITLRPRSETSPWLAKTHDLGSTSTTRRQRG